MAATFDIRQITSSGGEPWAFPLFVGLAVAVLAAVHCWMELLAAWVRRGGESQRGPEARLGRRLSDGGGHRCLVRTRVPGSSAGRLMPRRARLRA